MMRTHLLKTLPLLLLIMLLAAAGPLYAQPGTVYVLEATGAITPAMAGFMQRAVAAAEENDAEAIIILLDTPGGLLDATQDILQLFLSSEVPIVVYVAPRGAQAASAGSIITMAGHVAAMAPETVIGAASPVGDNGADLEETLYRKVSEDLKATTRNLTAGRSDEARELAVAMIDDARAVTAEEAYHAGLIDHVAQDLPDLLQQLHGQVVELNNSSLVLNTNTATIKPLPPTFIEQILLALANPLLLGILLALGIQAILIELSSPGGWVAGLIGVLALGLALYGLGQLPVNWLGLGLIIIAFILFLMEVKAATHGALAITGTLLLIGGILVLFNTPETPDFLAVSIPAAVALGSATALFFLFVAGKALKAQRTGASTGMEALLGKSGPVRSTFSSDTFQAPYSGMVLIAGELWRAQANEKVQEGEEITVTGLRGFTLQVERVKKG